MLTNTVVEAGADAAVTARSRARQRGIAVATDGNGRYCHIDPYRGGAIAVAEAARNVVCAGAHPVAVTDCLNFGNPERPDVYFQMEAVIHGIADACDALGTPVISGNVSLYNETGGPPRLPDAGDRHAGHPRRRHALLHAGSRRTRATRCSSSARTSSSRRTRSAAAST